MKRTDSVTKLLAQMPVQVREVDEKSRKITFVASDETVDRYNTVLSVEGWDFHNFRKNPVFLFGHNYRDPFMVMGTVPHIVTDKDKNEFRAGTQWMPPNINPVADMVHKYYSIKPAVLRTVSVGFIPLSYKELTDKDQTGLKQSGPKRKAGLRFTGQELLELSGVIIPANPNAGALAKKSIRDFIEQLAEEKELDPVSVMAARTALDDPDERQGLVERTFDWIKENGVEMPCSCHEGGCSIDQFCEQVWLEKDPNKKTYSLPSGVEYVTLEEEPEIHNDDLTVEQWAELRASTKIQTIICSKEVFKTAADAKKWCSGHEFDSSKMDETTDSFRFRQMEPTSCNEGSFRTITITTGVKAVICKPKSAQSLGADALNIVTMTKELFEELRAGAVLNRKNKRALAQAQQLIQNVLDSAEPPPTAMAFEREGDAITDPRLDEILDLNRQILSVVQDTFQYMRDIAEENANEEEEIEQQAAKAKDNGSLKKFEECLERATPKKPSVHITAVPKGTSPKKSLDLGSLQAQLKGLLAESE